MVLNNHLNLLIFILLKLEGFISSNVACVKGTVNTIIMELNTINNNSNKISHQLPFSLVMITQTFIAI